MDKSSIVKSKRYDETLNCYVVLLEKKDGKRFVIRDYRIGETYTNGETHDFPECEEIDKYETPSGDKLRQFTNMAPLKGTTTQLSVDSEGECKEVKESKIIPLEDKTDLMLTALVQILSYHQQSEPQETLKSVFAYRDALFGGKKQ